jgi:hypothetical protein
MYDFATNPLKLQRAIVLAGPDGDVKAEYIKLGGLLASGHEPTTVQVVVEEEVTVGATKPKKTKNK